MIALMSIGKRWRIAFTILAAAGAAAGARPVYRWWWNWRREAYGAECRTALSGRNWPELRRVAGEWSERDPLSADPWLYLAEAAQRNRDWQAAAEALAQIPDSDPKVAPALVELAKLEFGQLNRPRQGEEACLRLLRIGPRASFAHQRLIQYYALSLQREKLVKQIRFAVEEQREPPEAYVYLLLLDTLRMGNGVEVNEYWLEAHPDEELFLVARAIQVPEPRDEAGVAPDELEATRKASAGKLKVVESLLERFPANIELLAYKIEHCINRGETDCVADLMSRVPEAAEQDSRFWRFKGWLHETLDELPEAEAAYKQALEIHPLDWNAWNRLAVVYRRLQNPREVVRLTALVDQAHELRVRIRKLPAAEAVTPEILADLAGYARNCGAAWLADALDHRAGQEFRRATEGN
jgi:tetratricopeptide (TPR) repeat protein